MATLQRLVDREAFEALPAALTRYVEAVAANSPADWIEARELIEWARRRILAARARLAERKERLDAAARYRSL